MLTRDDFVAQYRNHTDEQLLQILHSNGSYSAAAIEAAGIVVSERGGLIALKTRMDEQWRTVSEVEWLRQEVTKLYRPGADITFIQTLVPESTLAPNDHQHVVTRRLKELEAEHNNRSVKPKTLAGCLLGGGLGSLIGGVLFGIQMAQVQTVFYIFIIGTALISYLFIKAITKQNRANLAVLVASLLSVPVALVIGNMLAKIFG